MPIPTPTTHLIAALVMLIGSLVLLADRTARMELEQAVGATLASAAHLATSAVTRPIDHSPVRVPQAHHRHVTHWAGRGPSGRA